MNTLQDEIQIQKLAAIVAAGLARNAEVCRRRWNPEMIARAAREVAEAIVFKIEPD